MSKAVSSKSSKAGKRWLLIATRILVALVMVFIAVAFIADIGQLVGVWALRASASSGVTDVTTTATHALDTVNNGLGRVNTLVQDARQKVAQVNDAAAKLGNRIEANSPVVTALNQLVGNNLAPRIENLRSTAASVHDAVLSFNGILVALNRLPNVTVPTLNSQLEAVSTRAQEAQAAVQDLRATVAGIKTGVATAIKETITNITTRIDAVLAQIQALVNKYQAIVTNTAARIVSISNNVILLLNISAVALTILFLIFAAGLVLLEYICWLYVRYGRFPSLRIVKPSIKVEAATAPSRVVEAKGEATSKGVPADDVTTTPAVVFETKEAATSAEVPKGAMTNAQSEVVEAEEAAAAEKVDKAKKRPATSKEIPAAEGSADPDTNGSVP